MGYWKKISFGWMGIAGMGCLAVVVAAQEPGEEMEYPMKPSPEHAVLKQDLGVWEGKITMWMEGPEGPESTSQGVETVQMLGDFWSLSTIEYDFGGQPTSGHAVIGFDPERKKYVGTWYEAGSPYRTRMEGDYDASAKTMTMKMKGVGPDGQPAEYKSVTHYPDENHRTFTMYGHMPDGGDQMVKMMVIEYTRRQ